MHLLNHEEVVILCELEGLLREAALNTEIKPSELKEAILLIENLEKKVEVNIVTDCLSTCLLCIQTAITELQRFSYAQSKDFTCKTEEAFDSFAAARKEAVQRTVVSKKSSLPSFSDVVGLDEVSSSDLVSSWSGQSEKMIRELFDDALAFDGVSIIFIDEVDSLCRKRCSNEDEGNRRIKTELLLQLQRLHCSKSKTVLICATNCPWDLDSAFLRRFDKKIYVGLPTFESRRVLLKELLSKFCDECSIDWDFLAHSTEGFSGDDIRRLAREIAFLQFRKYKERKKNLSEAVGVKNVQIFVSASEFNEVIQHFDRSVDSDTLNSFAEFK